MGTVKPGTLAVQDASTGSAGAESGPCLGDTAASQPCERRPGHPGEQLPLLLIRIPGSWGRRGVTYPGFRSRVSRVCVGSIRVRFGGSKSWKRQSSKF